MDSKILDLSPDVLGRRKIKFVLHEIHPDNTHWNHNGITYLEQYTRDNADSVKGMPLCAEFLDDDKDVPYGHGLTDNDGIIPLFEDSVQVGTCETWSIEDIEIDNEMHRCLCVTGYINENRYPHFVAWMEKQIKSGKPVYGSVEFTGTKDNDGEIIYDGGWKEEGRVPMNYDYAGYSIISIQPADDTALVIAFEMARNEFDDIFVENKVEKCSTDEFDIFGDTAKCTDMTDEWGFAITSERQPEEKLLSKAEYDRLITGEFATEDTDTNFDIFE